jgi:hypothetical protein
MHHVQNQAQNLVFGFVMFAGIIVSGAVLALVFLLRIMKPFFRNRIIRKARRNLFPILSLTRTRVFVASFI